MIQIETTIHRRGIFVYRENGVVAEGPKPFAAQTAKQGVGAIFNYLHPVAMAKAYETVGFNLRAAEIVNQEQQLEIAGLQLCFQGIKVGHKPFIDPIERVRNARFANRIEHARAFNFRKADIGGQQNAPGSGRFFYRQYMRHGGARRRGIFSRRNINRQAFTFLFNECHGSAFSQEA